MPKFAANLSLMFTELPFLQRFGAASRAGFKGVEFLFPYEHTPEAIAAELRAHDLQQVLFNMPPGNWEAGERGIAIFPDRRTEFRAGLDAAIDYAKALCCRHVHCLAGIAPPERSHAELFATYLENLKCAADALARHDLTLLIEPINTRDMPGYFLHATETAGEVIRAVGAPNLRLQYDVYHMHIMEGDAGAFIARHLDLIAHIQIADAPGRHEPGTGEIDFGSLFRHLDALPYEGWVGCEYRPRTTTLESLTWLRNRESRPES